MAAQKDKSSATVTSVMVSCILAGSGSRADCIISEQGSEFHGEFHGFVIELLRLLEIRQEFTSSHRAAAHGAVESVNRPLADTMAHLEATDEKWHLALPWAKLACNAGIHRALAMGGIGLSPAMVQQWYPWDASCRRQAGDVKR